MRRRVVRFIMVAVVALGCARAVHAQEVSLGGGAKMKIGGRFHMQYNTTSVDSSDGDPIPETEFLLRRARLTFDVTFNDLISARIEPDYSAISGVGLFSLRDAYMRLTFGSGLRATAGQFKRPFDVFELTSSTQILVAERGGQVRGVTACGRIATVCSYSNLSAGLLYSDRDLGLMLDGALVPGRLQYAVAATNGQTLRQRESNSGKQLTGRVSVTPLKDLVVSGNVGWKDYTNPASESAERALAWGADVEFGNYTKGPHVQAGIIGGGNWRALTADSTDIEDFLTGQVIGTWRFPVQHKWIDGVEPTFRASWADPNGTEVGDRGWLVTPGAMLHLGSRNRLYVNVDIWVPQVGDTEYALLTQLNFYF